MSVFEMAKSYYPQLWNKSRLIALVAAGKLSAKDYKTITGEAYPAE